MWMGTFTPTCWWALWLTWQCSSGGPFPPLCPPGATSPTLVPSLGLKSPPISPLSQPHVSCTLDFPFPRARPVLHVSHEVFIAPKTIDLEQPTCAGGHSVW